jgi:hypothetical protein
MKATLDIPDDLYRRVKARSAMEGRPVRSVAIQLFQNWLDAPRSGSAEPAEVTVDPAGRGNAPWIAIARKHLKPGMRHDMDEIRVAIARGAAAEYAEKLARRP